MNIASKFWFLNSFLKKRKEKKREKKKRKEKPISLEKWLILGQGRERTGEPGTFSCVKKEVLKANQKNTETTLKGLSLAKAETI